MKCPPRASMHCRPVTWSIASLTAFKKGKAEHLYSVLHGIQTTLKGSGMDHTAFNLQRTPYQLTSLYLVSVHQMAPPLNVVADI